MMNNGVFLIDKPEQLTSFQVVKKIRQITGEKKAGHTGTLDPFATGLLPICIGKATRISRFLLADDKTYRVQAKIGYQTDSGDITGTIIKQDKKTITKEDLETVLPAIKAIQKQIPPQYSAIKVNGKKAYQYARANQSVELAARDMKIMEFSLLDFDFPTFSYCTKVSKGTYIRTLTEQIAELLGTIATTTKLRRTQIGHLQLEKSVKLEHVSNENWLSYLVPIDAVLPQFPVISLNAEQTSLFLHGNSLPFDQIGEMQVLVKASDKKVIGMASLSSGFLQPQMVFKED